MSLFADDDFVPSNGEEWSQNEHNADDGNSWKDFDDDSDEGEASNHSTDIDEYGSFLTDYGKYQYDQARWGGIANTRNHSRAKKQHEGKREGEDKDESAEEDKSTVKVGIHFDAGGNLWYTHWAKRIPLSGKQS